jgi:hypothetical protein
MIPAMEPSLARGVVIVEACARAARELLDDLTNNLRGRGGL